MPKLRHEITGMEESVFQNPGNCSFLCARDPSILAYSQRPVISRDIGTNLECLFSEVEDSPSQTVKVYLRMKPYPPNIQLLDHQKEAYTILNKTTLLTKLPNFENMSQSKFKSNESVSKKYIFTQTFGPETTQLTIFDEAVKPHMIKFLKGEGNSVIMTYGTTNSGKSYTLRGKPNEPGIIPRGLEFVFSNINISDKLRFKPVHHSDVVLLNLNASNQEISARESLLAFNSSDKVKFQQNLNNFTAMQKALQDEIYEMISLDADAQYSVWVSFAEIYNETIYDLLTNDQSNRCALKLATDSKGHLFIKDLKMIHVNSSVEAYHIFMAGQYNLKIAATALNAGSSRSHCIFQIKLLKFYENSTPSDVEVSTFTFCDLAGSERLNKTLNVGDRLKEAQNINTSLLVLSRCLKSIYESQTGQVKKKTDIVGPFRESKLTRLFQSALSGKEHIALIVNINPIPKLYIETQHVLKFSAIAKKIVQETKPKKKTKPMRTRFSMAIEHSRKSITDWDSAAILSTESAVEEISESIYIDEEEYLEIINENKELKKKIRKMEAEQFQRDTETRAELARVYTDLIEQKEKKYKQELKNQEVNLEEYMEFREAALREYFEEQLEKLKERRQSKVSSDEEEDEVKIDLHEKLKQYKEHNEQLMKEYDSCKFELKNVQHELEKCQQLLEARDNTDTNYIDELKLQLAKSEECSNNLRQLLNDAKEEYLELTKNNEMLEYKIANYERQMQENMERVSDLEEQVVMFETCLADKNAEIETLQNEISNYETQLEQQTKEIVKKEILIASLESDKKSIEDIMYDSCSKVTKLEKQLAEKVYEIEMLENELKSSNVSLTKDTDTEEEPMRTKEMCDFQQQISPVEHVDNCCQTDELTTINCKENNFTQNSDSIKNEIEKLQEENKKLSLKIEESSENIKRKEEKIQQLQQAIKTLDESSKIKESLNENMEREIKKLLREVTQLKENMDKLKNEEIQMKKMLADKEDLVDKLEAEVTRYEQEMESFKKNRDDALTKYDELIATKNNEISMLKEQLDKETSKCKTFMEESRKAKDIAETSEDEVVSSAKKASNRRRVKERDMYLTSEEETSARKRVTRQTGRRHMIPLTPTSANDDVNIIDVSSTDSKKPAFSLAPPQSLGIKRTRRKQLFQPDDSENIDLSETVNIVDSPHYNTRSLRKRKT